MTNEVATTGPTHYSFRNKQTDISRTDRGTAGKAALSSRRTCEVNQDYSRKKKSPKWKTVKPTAADRHIGAGALLLGTSAAPFTLCVEDSETEPRPKGATTAKTATTLKQEKRYSNINEPIHNRMEQTDLVAQPPLNLSLSCRCRSHCRRTGISGKARAKIASKIARPAKTAADTSRCFFERVWRLPAAAAAQVAEAILNWFFAQTDPLRGYRPTGCKTKNRSTLGAGLDIIFREKELR